MQNQSFGIEYRPVGSRAAFRPYFHGPNGNMTSCFRSTEAVTTAYKAFKRKYDSEVQVILITSTEHVVDIKALPVLVNKAKKR